MRAASAHRRQSGPWPGNDPGPVPAACVPLFPPFVISCRSPALVQVTTDGGTVVSLEDLYRQYADTVYTLALRLTGSREDAEDIVQDLFVGLPRALKSYREQGRFESWLKRIAVRLCLTRLRSRSRRREVPIEAVVSELTREAVNPADIVALERVILSLPDALRSVFVLREIEGFSHEEIAAMLNITAANSAQRLSRAWRRLRKEAAHA